MTLGRIPAGMAMRAAIWLTLIGEESRARPISPPFDFGEGEHRPDPVIVCASVSSSRMATRLEMPETRTRVISDSGCPAEPDGPLPGVRGPGRSEAAARGVAIDRRKPPRQGSRRLACPLASRLRSA